MPDLSTITPVTREEEFLDRIARAAASPNLPEVDASDNGDVLTVVSGEWAAAAPAGGLPEVTSSDNGDVLTVVSGEWAAAAPTGDNPLEQIAVTVVTPGLVYTLDKNYNELKAIINSGKIPYISFLKTNDGDEDSGYEAFFTAVGVDLHASWSLNNADPNDDYVNAYAIFSEGSDLSTFYATSFTGVLTMDLSD